MNKEEQRKLAKFVAEYIEEDVAVVFNRLHNEATLLGLVTEAVNEYSDRQHLIDKKKCMREMVSIIRERCGGSKMPFTMIDEILSFLVNGIELASELKFESIEESLRVTQCMLKTDPNLGTRIRADQILCSIINNLDREIKDALV